MCRVLWQDDLLILYSNKISNLDLIRAIYGCIQSSLLWYELYTETLMKEGFVLNSYDKCIATKVINGKQCTLGFYVDDNKLSHVEEGVVEEIWTLISKHFGNISITKETSISSWE